MGRLKAGVLLLVAVALIGSALGGSSSKRGTQASGGKAHHGKHRHQRKRRHRRTRLGRDHRRHAPVPQAPSACRAHGGLPDRSCTPGVSDPRVTQRNIQQTICRTGYTKTVRPPSSYTTPLKERQMAAYGYYAGHSTASYEEDHLISLELGGSPTDPRNLWPEAHGPGLGSYQKDSVANALHKRVCDGAITLAAARRLERSDWVRAYRP
jgi:hypothetical protein